MKKLCFVTFQFKTGGVERVFCGLAPLLTDEIMLLNVTAQYDSMANNIPSNVKIIRLEKNAYFRLLYRWRDSSHLLYPIVHCILLTSIILHLKFSPKYKDWIFINFADTLTTLFVSYLGTHSSKRFSWIHYNPRTINKSRYAAIYKYIYRKIDKIVCICNEQRDILLQIIPGLDKEKTIVIYNPLDYNKMSVLKDEVVPINDKYIVMVARFDLRSKDFYTIIDAYSLLEKNIRDNYKLVFVGDGPDEKVIEKYVQIKSLENRIVFAGLQENPYKWISNAKLLVHSSLTEGLPTVLLESLACGTPVISTNCETGPKEILNYGKCGILVKIQDPLAMADAITKMLTNDGLCKQFIIAGHAYLQHFSIDNIESKIKQIWTK